jgi:hypothetical protein
LDHPQENHPGDLSVIFLRRPLEAWRRIRFVRAGNDGLYNEDGWSEFRYRSRSAYRLRNELARRLGCIDRFIGLIMCVRAGRYGRLTPLVQDLPRHRYDVTIEIVVLMDRTPGESLSLYVPNSLLISFWHEILAGSLDCVMHNEQLLVVLIYWNGMLICLCLKKKQLTEIVVV